MSQACARYGLMYSYFIYNTFVNSIKDIICIPFFLFSLYRKSFTYSICSPSRVIIMVLLSGAITITSAFILFIFMPLFSVSREQTLAYFDFLQVSIPTPTRLVWHSRLFETYLTCHSCLYRIYQVSLYCRILLLINLSFYCFSTFIFSFLTHLEMTYLHL